MSPRVPFPRIEGDAYYTPDDVAAACVATIAHRVLRARIIEPSAGGGAFLRALGRVGVWRSNTVAVDINPNAEGLRLAGSHHVGDFLTMPQPEDCAPLPVWVIGNPPYKHALEHVEHAISLAIPERGPTGGVGFLLRLAFLEGQKRAAFWREHPASEVHVLTRRPSFVGGKTDSCAYAFFVWRDWVCEPLRWIP